MSDLGERRRKLLSLFLDGKVGTDLLTQEDERLRRRITEVEQQRNDAEAEAERIQGDAARFEDAVVLLRTLDVDAVWGEATEQERRVMVEDLVQEIAVFPDHLEVQVTGAPRLNVQLEEVGLTEGWQIVRVGGGI